jgi:hypothetical protein
MNELISLRDRFMQDPLPIRLGNLASNLAQIHSLSGHDGHRDGVARFVEESALYIEWVAPDATLELQILLLDIQRTLVQWKRQWTQLWDDAARRTEAARKARAWSEQVLAASGLLEVQSRRP